MVKEKKTPLHEEHIEMTGVHDLVLHNDEHNTFQFVVETLVEVCDHDLLQAEQCTLIAHHKGKCTVKSGEQLALKPISDEMTRRGLTVTIE